MKINEDDREKVKEINEGISGALETWQEVMLLADADGWSYALNYTDKDLLNSLYIFNHIWQNVGIKRGRFKNDDDAYEKMRTFVGSIKETFGVDTRELTEKVFGANGKDRE